MAEYEIHQFHLARDVSRSAMRQILTDRAEYGGWELTRVRRYRDGRCKVTLRRRIIRATKTLHHHPSDLLR